MESLHYENMNSLYIRSLIRQIYDSEVTFSLRKSLGSKEMHVDFYLTYLDRQFEVKYNFIEENGRFSRI